MCCFSNQYHIFGWIQQPVRAATRRFGSDWQESRACDIGSRFVNSEIPILFDVILFHFIVEPERELIFVRCELSWQPESAARYYAPATESHCARDPSCCSPKTNHGHKRTCTLTTADARCGPSHIQAHTLFPLVIKAPLSIPSLIILCLWLSDSDLPLMLLLLC